MAPDDDEERGRPPLRELVPTFNGSMRDVVALVVAGGVAGGGLRIGFDIDDDATWLVLALVSAGGLLLGIALLTIVRWLRYRPDRG